MKKMYRKLLEIPELLVHNRGGLTVCGSYFIWHGVSSRETGAVVSGDEYMGRKNCITGVGLFKKVFPDSPGLEQV